VDAVSLGETEQRGRGAADGGEDATSDRASARIPGLDASTRRFGPCAGNTPTEAPVAACEKLGIRTGVDPLRMFDVAEDIGLPILKDSEPSLSRRHSATPASTRAS